MTSRRDPELDAFAHGARDMLDAELAEDRAVPDALEVVERAREIAPRRVPEAMVHAGRSLGSVVPLGEASRVDAQQAIEPFASGLRGLIEDDLAERRLAGIPQVSREPDRRRAVRGMAAAAAIALLVFGVVGGIGLDRLSPVQPTQAIRAAGETGRSGTAAVRVEHVAPVPTADLRDSIAHPHEPVPARAAATVSTADSQDGAAAGSDPARGRTHAKRSGRADAIARLEREAAALWSNGELAGAEAALRQIIKLAGRSARSELAYGDLFSVVHQRSGERARASAWSAYLGKFPRGRYADDVRASLCRRSTVAERRACWRRYLKTNPGGAHRREANALLADPR